jgi:hypothetical protein
LWRETTPLRKGRTFNQLVAQGDRSREKEPQMSRTRNATQVLAIAVLAALFAVPLASAATRPPVQSAQVKQAIHALVVRGEALNRIYHLGPYAHPSTEAVRALEVRGQALDRIYHLGPYADATKQAVEALRIHPCTLSTCSTRYLVQVA